MRAIPAIDLRDAACVQLIGGSYAREAVRIADPVAVARRWEDAGFRELHIVDLDAATGVGSNAGTIADIVRMTSMHCQVGGGIRSSDAVARVLDAGADRVVMGTRALEDADWLLETATAFPNRVVVAADVLDNTVVVRGWQNSTGRSIQQVLASLATVPLAAVLVTAVHKEGRMAGPDLDLAASVMSASTQPVQASGGIASLADIRALAELGVSAVILGMSLYTGALDPRLTSSEFK